MLNNGARVLSNGARVLNNEARVLNNEGFVSHNGGFVSHNEARVLNANGVELSARVACGFAAFGLKMPFCAVVLPRFPKIGIFR